MLDKMQKVLNYVDSLRYTEKEVALAYLVGYLDGAENTPPDDGGGDETAATLLDRWAHMCATENGKEEA